MSYIQFRVATIRGNQGKFLPSGKSGNFNIFCPESGKVRENDLAEVTQNLSLISRHIFVKTQWLQVQNFPRFARDFTRYPSDLCREVRESQGKVRRKSQGKSGNSNRADWWQPCS